MFNNQILTNSEQLFINDDLQILEGILNNRVLIDPAFMERMVAFIQPQSLNSTTSLSILSKMPQYLHDPDPYIMEIGAAYCKLRDDIQKIRSYLDKLPSTDLKSFSSAAVFQKFQAQSGYSVILSLLTILNALLRVYTPENPALRKETTLHCEKIIHEAKVASCFRPLGAGYIALCLVVALATAEDPDQIKRIDKILADYQTDSKNTNWRRRAMLLKRTLEYHRLRVGSGGLDENRSTDSGLFCCVM